MFYVLQGGGLECMRQDEQERLELRQSVVSELSTGLYILVLIVKDPYLGGGVLESQRSFNTLS